MADRATQHIAASHQQVAFVSARAHDKRKGREDGGVKGMLIFNCIVKGRDLYTIYV